MRRPALKEVIRPVLYVVLALVLFVVGVLVGQGRISFGSRAGVTGLPDQLNYSTVNQVYDSLKANYDGKLTETQLLDGLKKGLAESTKDPYTEYFTATEAKDFSNELNNSFSGIGAELSQDADGNISIIAPISGFPAEKAGLKAKDIIVSINGESTSGMSVDTAVSKIRGKSGTKVTLQIVRGGSQQLSFTITRQNIQIPSVNTKVLPGNIGYMQIITFADDTAKLAQAAADKFAGAHVKGIVLDLRDNPGGLLDAAVHVSSLWLPSGDTILQEKRGSVVVNTYTAGGSDTLEGIPTVVLINGGSASASEITAGALHDNKAAWLIGVKSYGKGVVQQLENFADGSELKVTVASWYRPNGENINKQGIKPDQIVQLTDQDAKAGTDTQLLAAERYLAQH
jgi:carboxyl-terminal processing protease